MSKKQRSPDTLASQDTPWNDLVILCRKCGGKLKGGFGEDGESDLRRALRDELREQGRRREVRILETGCFGVCPKGAVVALRGHAPERLLIVPKGQRARSTLAGLGIGRETSLPE